MIFNKTGEQSPLTESSLSIDESAVIIEAVLLSELNSEELTAFLESRSDVHDALRMEAVVEKSIVRLDKQAKINRAYMASVYSIARKKKDKKFKKLELLWKLEAVINKYLMKRYGNEAMREAKKSVQRAGKSNSNLVKKAVDNVKKSLNNK